MRDPAARHAKKILISVGDATVGSSWGSGSRDRIRGMDFFDEVVRVAVELLAPLDHAMAVAGSWDTIVEVVVLMSVLLGVRALVR